MAEPVSRDQILRHVRGQGNINFPCSADHEQDWQPYPVDPYSAICDDHTYILDYKPLMLYGSMGLISYIITTLFNYVLHCFSFVWCLCMAINVSVQVSPRHYTVDPMLLPSGNPFKCHEDVLSLQPMVLPKTF